MVHIFGTSDGVLSCEKLFPLDAYYWIKKSLVSNVQDLGTEGEQTTNRKNNNLEKCAGMGLNGFYIKWIIGIHCNWKNQNPGNRLGATN